MGAASAFAVDYLSLSSRSGLKGDVDQMETAIPRLSGLSGLINYVVFNKTVMTKINRPKIKWRNFQVQH